MIKYDILFISSRLGNGGAEKHLVRLLNNWANGKLKLLLTRPGGNYENLLNTNITKAYLSKASKSYFISLIYSVFTLYRLLRKNKPAVIVSFQDGPNIIALIAKKISRSPVKIIICVQNNPINLLQNRRLISIYWLAKVFYHEADYMIALSKGIQKTYIKLVPFFKKKSTVIHNIGYPEMLERNNFKFPYLNEKEIRIVFCGRFVRQKNLPLLIDAFTKVLDDNHEVKLFLIGEGKDETKIRERVKSKGIQDNVEFVGFIPDPTVYFKNGDIFVLSSSWEGFGNVIVEAMACGIPVISTDCPFGPAEIISNGINGILVPPNDVEKLSEAIIYLLNNPEVRKRISIGGIKRAKNFQAKSIVNQYKKIINQIVLG